MRTGAIFAVIAVSLALVGCSSANFLVYKDARHFYVTSKSDSLRSLLCDSGDQVRITGDAALDQPLQKELYESICASDKVKERVLAALEGMSKEQRTALKLAFQMNSYEINIIANC